MLKLANVKFQREPSNDDYRGSRCYCGCAGMAYMRGDLAQRSGVMLVDGLVAAAHLARAAVAMGQ